MITWKQGGVIAFLALILGGAYLAGRNDANSAWKLKESERLAKESSQAANLQGTYRLIEQGRVIEREKAVQDAQEKLSVVQANYDHAVADADGLREQVRRYAVRIAADKATSNLSAAERSKAGSASADMLANVFGELARAAGDYARQADRNRIAGLTCERIYESTR